MLLKSQPTELIAEVGMFMSDASIPLTLKMFKNTDAIRGLN